MSKCKIIQEEKDIFEVTNGLISLIFYKIGSKQGQFDIIFDKDRAALRECYANVSYFLRDSKNLAEITSIDYCFEDQVEIIDNELGQGFKIRFGTICEPNQPISFNIQFKIFDKQDFLQIKIIDINDSSEEPLSIHSISPLTIKNSKLWLSGTQHPTNLKNISWFKNGWQSWSPCKVFFGVEKDRKGPPIKMIQRDLDNQDYTIKGRFYSEYCTVITDLNRKNSLILGFLTFQNQLSRIILDFKNSSLIKLLTAICCMDGVNFAESNINSSEELFVCFKPANLGYYGLIEYAKRVMGYIEETRITEVPVGWCSWYYYYTKINEEEMIKNFKFFDENKDILPIDFIQLDDGYQEAIGDYNITNEKFPNGLAPLFSQINNANFRGGIWTGPFFAVKNSKVFQNHPDWFLKKRGSNKLLKALYNWGAFEYSLDMTNPEVLDHIKNLFTDLLYALQDKNKREKPLIDFFKIDFIYSAIPLVGDYKNKSFTRAQILHRAVKMVREAIGEESFLLGCGAPLGPCVGLVDAMRIGTDTAPYWKLVDSLGEKFAFSAPSLKRGLLPILYRSFMHKYFWINDPDCLMIRRTNTKLSQDEINLQITLFGLSGGQILISDDMSQLTKEEINDAKLVIPPYNPEEFDPIPTDIFYSKYPSVYTLETFEDIGKRYLTTIINWGDKPIKRTVSIAELIPNLLEDELIFFVWEFWSKKYYGEYTRIDQLELEINPHSCYYFSIIPFIDEMKEEPIFLSSDLHITQGCSEITEFEYDDEEKKINIIIDLIGRRNGHIYLKLPRNLSISNCTGAFSEVDKNSNIWEIGITFEENDIIEIQLT
ncbi:MAG: alpha-galactosidase [Promethearchaeota archaeon]|nr:MAG: alpha-galactosidase [Candidatus Lokiarchaeota archaeon]